MVICHAQLHAAICYMFLYFSWNNFSILPLNNVLFAPTLKHSHFPKPLQITRNSHGQYQIRRRIKFNVDVQNSLRWFIWKLLEKEWLRLLQVSFTYCCCSYYSFISCEYIANQNWMILTKYQFDNMRSSISSDDIPIFMD